MKWQKLSPVIDRPSRDFAASLIRRFRDGALTNDQFQDEWPSNREDRALGALATMLWHFYDDRKEHTLTGRHALTLDGREFFDRCVLFAESDLPYEWPEEDFIGINGLGWRLMVILSLGSLLWLRIGSFGWPLVVVSIGLIFLLDRRIRQSNARIEAKLKATGDMDLWPFIRRSDYDAARSEKSSSPDHEL